ncbi:hypothetical protein PYV02_01445 [Leifsonia sp. H3M29-4]|uniref:hypothetical protein n=1 Tax=Salinibacterium metalliresistens TaxID=3031321 RepID=UPI0023DA2513|nr:hypothetical protein [Salinibacterium metalliresistens]MDF1477743.1 hypothetical protein [Salinibacterium metalliresistens]
MGARTVTCNAADRLGKLAETWKRESSETRRSAAYVIMATLRPAIMQLLREEPPMLNLTLVDVDAESLLFVVAVRLSDGSRTTLLLSAGLGEMLALYAQHPFATTVAEALECDDFD